jgi:D-beta-D-heptose 7-phosphate kinase/D-beta-D-heptose 1-phosphate adenosyltransferase
MKGIGVAELRGMVRTWRKAGQTVVWTNGCFDLLHAGHVHALQQARSFGDVLIVGVNSDASVCRLKGPGRPIFPLEQRVYVLASVFYVGAVVPFDDDTPEALIEQLRPDVLAKGEEYRGQCVPGEQFAREVRHTRMLPGVSTTELIRRIAALATTVQS